MKKKQQQQVDRNFHGDRSHHPWMCGGNGSACASCWDSDVVMQAYRSAAAGTVRRLSSALFGQELLAVEAARTSAAERERMLEGRARALFESQVWLSSGWARKSDTCIQRGGVAFWPYSTCTGSFCRGERWFIQKYAGKKGHRALEVDGKDDLRRIEDVRGVTRMPHCAHLSHNGG